MPGLASTQSSVAASSAPSLMPGQSTIWAWTSMPPASRCSSTSIPRSARRPMRLRRTSGLIAWMETFIGERPHSTMRSASSSETLVSVTKLPCRKERR